MKITAKQYASALYAETKGREKAEIDSVVSGLVRVLAKNRQLNLAKKIIDAFEKIYNKENSIVAVRLTSREKLESKLVEKISDHIRSEYDCQAVEILQEADPKILGGIVLRIGDTVVDGSLSGQLKSLKKKII